VDRRPSARRRAVVALVALLTVVAVTVTAAALAANAQRDARRAELRAVARQSAAVLRAAVEQPAVALDAADALLDEGDVLDEAAFQRWGEVALRDTAVIAVAYSRPVQPAEREAVEAALGLPLRDLERPGVFRPAAERELYWPVLTVTPQTAEARSVLGLDLTSSQVRSDAIVEAITEGRTVLARPTTMAGGGQTGLGLYHPLRSLDGTFVGVLSAQMSADRFTEVVGRRLPPGVAVRVTEGERSFLTIGTPGADAVARPVDVLGRRWTVEVDDRGAPAGYASTILTGGLTATGFLALVFALWLRRDRRIESRQRLIEDLTVNTPDPILIKDRLGRYLFANDAGARALGLTGGSEAVGRTDAELLDPDTARGIRAHDREVIATAEPAAFEEVIHTADGERYYLTTRSPYRNRSGGVVGVFAVARDITERRLDERRRAAVAALAAAVGSQATVGPLAEAAAASIRASLGADVVRVAVQVAERQLEVLAADGAGGLSDEDRYVPLDASHALATAARERRVVTVGDRAEWLRRFPEAGPLVEAEELHATVCCPFTSAQQLGVVSLSWRRPRPVTDDELRTLSDLLAVLGEALARARSTELERDAVAALQHALLPIDTFPDTPLDIAVRYSPALRGLELGGDWYDLFALDEGRIGVVTGDVVGRGAAAAAVMGQLRAALRAISMSRPEPAEALAELDRFCATTDGAFCTTVVYGVLDPATRQFTFASAGHLPPLLSDPVAGTRPLEDVRGLPLGVVPEGADRPQATVELAPGSTLLLFTDGLVERRDRAIDDGIDHLAASLDRFGTLPIEALADRLLATVATDAEDDTALVCLHLPGPDATTLTCRIDADLAELGAVRRRLRSWFADRGVDDAVAEDLLLAAVEAVTNSIEHGYRRDPGHQTVVELSDVDGVITVTVRDRGRWNGRRPNRDRGRGLHIIEAVMDDARITSSRHGTTLHMSKLVPRTAGRSVLDAPCPTG
jgi:PAS domain S-box-containing protein